MKRYLNIVAVRNGFIDYEQYFDWVSRDGENPVVTAQLIESIYKASLTEVINDLIVRNYSGCISIEEWDSILNELKVI